MSLAAAEQAVREGDLDGALRNLQDQVRKEPSKAELRVFLFQLLAVMGQWERANTQLNVAVADLYQSRFRKVPGVVYTAGVRHANNVAKAFRDAGINLSHIDKRPSGRSNWQYTFFIDCQGHRRDPAMAAALEEARGHCVSLRILGSYPRARRIL